MSDIVSLGFLALVLILVIVIFVRVSLRLKRGGGSLTTIVLGATDEFLTKDRSKAAETIVNENAGKKFEDQSSTEPQKLGKPQNNAASSNRHTQGDQHHETNNTP